MLRRDYQALDLALDELRIRRNILKAKEESYTDLSGALAFARMEYWETARRAREIISQLGDPVIFDPDVYVESAK